MRIFDAFLAISQGPNFIFFFCRGPVPPPPPETLRFPHTRALGLIKNCRSRYVLDCRTIHLCAATVTLKERKCISGKMESSVGKPRCWDGFQKFVGASDKILATLAIGVLNVNATAAISYRCNPDLIKFFTTASRKRS